jgi:hypothetical protein
MSASPMLSSLLCTSFGFDIGFQSNVFFLRIELKSGG